MILIINHVEYRLVLTGPVTTLLQRGDGAYEHWPSWKLRGGTLEQK